MMLRLLLLLVLVPLVELLILIEIGQQIGTIPTIAIVVVTGLWGAWLARRQGLEVLNRARYQLSHGVLPAEPLMDGILILLAGALLVTPGILTDIAGFLALIPATRQLLKQLAWRIVQRVVQDEGFHVTVHTPASKQSRTPEGAPRGNSDSHQGKVRRIYPVLVDRSPEEKNCRQ